MARLAGTRLCGPARLRRLGGIGGRVGSRSGWDLQALYGLEAGKQYFGQVGSLRVALHF